MLLLRHRSSYYMSMQEYYLVALAQQRPEEEPSLDMKSAVSTAMNKLVTSSCFQLQSLAFNFLDGVLHLYAAILTVMRSSCG